MQQPVFPPTAMAPPQPTPAAQALDFPMHKGARGAYIVVGILLILLVVTIPFAIWVFIASAGAHIQILGDELIYKHFFTTRWKLSSLRRLGTAAIPVIARGIGGALARAKVGGAHAIHLCAIDDKGKNLRLLVSMYDRFPELINHVSHATRLPVEELKVGLLSPKWPEPRA